MQSGCEGAARFSYEPCNGSYQILYGFSDYIKEARWEGDTLIINPVVNYNCAARRIKGHSEVKDGDIVLETRTNIGFLNAMCYCDYDTWFKFYHLEKKQYNIILTGEGKELDRLTLNPDNSVVDNCEGHRTVFCYGEYIFKKRFPENELSIESIINESIEYLQQSEEDIFLTIHNQKILINERN